MTSFIGASAESGLATPSPVGPTLPAHPVR
jgi:hypothetical protein